MLSEISFSNSVAGGVRGRGPGQWPELPLSPELCSSTFSPEGFRCRHQNHPKNIKVRDENSALGLFCHLAQTFCSVIAFSIHYEQKNIYLTMTMLVVLDRSVIF